MSFPLPSQNTSSAQPHPQHPNAFASYDISQAPSPQPDESDAGDDRPPPSPSSTSQNSDEGDADQDLDSDLPSSSRAFSLAERRATLRQPFAAPSSSVDQSDAEPVDPSTVSSTSDSTHQPVGGCYSPFNLPAEIVVHIFKFLLTRTTGHRYLRNCILVCRFWSDCGVSLLWHRPSFLDLSLLVKMIHVLNSPDQTYAYSSFIRRLNFSGVAKDLSDQFLGFMSLCTQLERLALGECKKVTNDTLQHVLPSLKNLMSIDLTGIDNITDRTLFALAEHCKRLQGINLTNCKKITSAGVAALGENCKTLRRVKLCGCEKVDSEGVFRMIQKCPHLLEIDLYNCPRVSDLAVRHVWIFSSHVRELRLSNCGPMTDMAFPAPPRLYSNSTAALDLDSPMNLYRDHLHSTVGSFQGSDSAPASRGSSPSGLINGRISPSEPDSAAAKGFTVSMSTPLRPPKLFEHLRVLDLTSCPTISDNAVEGIIACAPRIRNLTLSKCTRLTDEAVFSIAKLKKFLQYLHLGHVANITDRSVRHLVNNCTRLRYLDLACCSQLTDLSVTEIAAKLPKLKRVGLVRVQRITDESLYTLVDRHLTLQRIHLSYCANISVAAVFWLLERLEKVTHISLTGVPGFRRPELQKFCRQPPEEFSPHQRESFCVYSGHGVRDLQHYLRSVYSSEETAARFGNITPEVQRAIQLVRENAEKYEERMYANRRLYFGRHADISSPSDLSSVHHQWAQHLAADRSTSHPLAHVAGNMPGAPGPSSSRNSLPSWPGTESGETRDHAQEFFQQYTIPEPWRTNVPSLRGQPWLPGPRSLHPRTSGVRSDPPGQEQQRGPTGYASQTASSSSEQEARLHQQRMQLVNGLNNMLSEAGPSRSRDPAQSSLNGASTYRPAPYITQNEPAPIGHAVSGNGLYHNLSEGGPQDPVQYRRGSTGPQLNVAGGSGSSSSSISSSTMQGTSVQGGTTSAAEYAQQQRMRGLGQQRGRFGEPGHSLQLSSELDAVVEREGPSEANRGTMASLPATGTALPAFEALNHTPLPRFRASSSNGEEIAQADQSAQPAIQLPEPAHSPAFLTPRGEGSSANAYDYLSAGPSISNHREGAPEPMTESEEASPGTPMAAEGPGVGETAGDVEEGEENDEARAEHVRQQRLAALSQSQTTTEGADDKDVRMASPGPSSSS